MKLRRISLANVRRFLEPVTIGPIGDGITLLCQPNESGKSTLFDALHAAFFVKHTSWSGEVSGLQPYSGGKVSVAVDLDIDGRAWRIEKTWQKGSGGQALVLEGGVVRHQGDEADHWISDLIAGEGGGPSGLLWVRQGRTTLQPNGTRTENEAEHAQRRDLLTVISGAMDAVTGGQRMDAALDACRAALKDLETSTGRPKAGGPWADAEDAVEVLRETAARLERQVADLRDDLERRRRMQAELTDVDDPKAAEQRKTALKEAEDAFAKATRHADQVEAAKTRARLAAQTLQSAEEDAARRASLVQRLKDAEDKAATAADLAGTAAATQETLHASHDQAQTALREASDALKTAQQDLAAAMRRDAVVESAGQRDELQQRIADAEAAEQSRIAHTADAMAGPTKDQAASVEAAMRAVQAAEVTQDRRAPRFVIDYDDGAPELRQHGSALKGKVVHKAQSDAPIEVPGIARITLLPASDDDEGALRQATDALAKSLTAAGVPDKAALDAARAHALQAADLAERAKARRDALAPDGVEALKLRLAALPAVTPQTAALPPTPDVETAVAAAERALHSAEAAELTARAELGTARDAATAARTSAREAADQVEGLERDMTALPAPPKDPTAHLAELRSASAAAAAAVQALDRDAQDPTTLKARLDRLKNVEAQTARRVQTLREGLAELRASIGARAEEGVEEALVDATAQLSAAEDRLQNVRFDVDVWRRLKGALEAAQGAARDRYFAPVAQELRPLLEDLWGDAELIWAEDTLLPKALVRKGTEERLDILSGGTQEQIAFFVRLAFARLLARSGRHAPLILDDALVFSDDDRIAHMFDALHAAADDLQIIVLSCRQRAFRDLGAPEVRFLTSE